MVLSTGDSRYLDYAYSSTLALLSTLKAGPDFIPYMFFASQQRITRITSNSTLWIFRHKFLVPVMNFRSFFDA